MKRKKKNNGLIVILLLLLITVGFATLSTTLNINGLTKIKGNTWDIYFENIVVKDGSVEADTPVITDKTKVSFEVQLEKPGDYYEFNVDVKNNGTIDAMIESITKSSLTSGQSVYLDYNVTGISEKALLKATGKKTVTVKVSFKDVDSSQLPSVTEPINLSFSFDAVQADSTAVQDVSIEDLDNDGKTSVGDLVTVGTERFYVISNNDGEVRALAEWNLLVGNQDDGFGSATPLANPTGLQDSSAKGWHYAEGTTTVEYPSIGTTRFSISFYWGGTEGVTIDLTNSANLINGYLINYKNSLKELGLDTKEVTLITKSELETLGCRSSNFSCKLAPSWVYQTTYWSRSARDPFNVWSVDSDGVFVDHDCGHDISIGVRPVISFLESEI